MCGLIGFIAKSNKSIRAIFEANVQSIADRGRYFDYMVSDDASFGYARLPTDAINNREIDNIQKTTENYFLYNGLVTNTDYLSDKFSFSEKVKLADTACMFKGFTRFGKSFLSSCRGMFAFAHVTPTTITLVRDTIGIKPLYYITTKDTFGFCSEMKGLKKMLHAKVYEVLPGQIIVFDRKTKKISKDRFIYKSYKRYRKKDLKICLLESVITPTKRYLEQSVDKKIAVLLSGGVDSSIILSLLHNSLDASYRKRIVGFNLGVSNASDTKVAKKLAKSLGFKLIIVKPYTEQTVLEKLAKIIYKVESKYARVIRVALLQEALAEKIQQQGIEVVLSGEGADELFFGYERFIKNLEQKQTEKLFTYFFKKVFYYTLLQRYERIFARRQIEGRVPFLDQELIVLAKKFSVAEKITVLSNKQIVKNPLRKLAKEMGLPSYIYNREKIKMTVGATNQTNEEDQDAYLESYIQEKKGMSFSQLVRTIYMNYFSLSTDLLSKHSLLGSEEVAMRQVKGFVQHNQEREKYLL